MFCATFLHSYGFLIHNSLRAVFGRVTVSELFAGFAVFLWSHFADTVYASVVKGRVIMLPMI